MERSEQKEVCKNKKAYDKKGAQTIRNAFWNKEHKEFKIYPCPVGNHWHLASKGRQ